MTEHETSLYNVLDGAADVSKGQVEVYLTISFSFLFFFFLEGGGGGGVGNNKCPSRGLC